MATITVEALISTAAAAAARTIPAQAEAPAASGRSGQRFLHCRAHVGGSRGDHDSGILEGGDLGFGGSFAP
jgi:hypothetical protein